MNITNCITCNIAPLEQSTPAPASLPKYWYTCPRCNRIAPSAYSHAGAQYNWNKAMAASGKLPGAEGMTILPDEDLDAAWKICGKCGAKLQIVRPGKWQCPQCE